MEVITHSNNIDENTNALMLLKSEGNNLNPLKLYSPVISLTGHKGEVYSGSFSNEGYLYASAGFDKSIMIWEVFDENCKNIQTLTGHSNAIMQLKWSQDDSKIYSCSADKTVSIWDVYECKRIRKLKGHEAFVNSLDSTKKGLELVFAYLFRLHLAEMTTNFYSGIRERNLLLFLKNSNLK
jgi:WD40 repeat protein